MHGCLFRSSLCRCLHTVSRRTFTANLILILFSDCYCADDLGNITTVTNTLCNVPCPGNPNEHCGGSRNDPRLARRQAAVPVNALLAIYVNPTLLQTTSTTLQPANTATASNSNTIGTPGLLTATAIATKTLITVAPVSTVSSIMDDCVSGYCNPHGYIFEPCTTAPVVGETVFVIEACGCDGGRKYVPANCTWEACLGLTTYMCVPVNGSAGRDIIYKPETCDDCSGGVAFVPSTSADAQSTTVSLINPTFMSSSTSTAVSNTSSSTIVAAGAGRPVVCSSIILVFGSFVLLSLV